MSRNIDAFEEATESLFLPIKDVKIDVHDTIKCRIIKFGKKNTIEWKPRLNTETGDMEDQRPTTHFRIYLYVYEYGKAKNKYRSEPEFEGKFITINPQIKWISELKALHEQLSNSTGDKERIFKHKIEINRQEAFFKAKDGNDVKYSFLKIDDLGPDENFADDEHSSISDVDEDSTQAKTPKVKTQDLPKKEEQKENVSDKLRKIFSTSSDIDEMTSTAKGLVEKSSNDDVKKKILEIFNECKILKIKSIIKETEDPTEIGQVKEFLLKKYIRQDRKDQISEIEEFAKDHKKSISLNLSRSYEDRAAATESDEIPF